MSGSSRSTAHPASGSDVPVLEVRGLSARIAGQQVVEDVTFSVPATGVTAVLGRNGVGKTSTLKAVLGLIERRGEVLLAGERVDGERTDRIVRRGVGYVPEDREVFAGLTVAENLRLAERDAQPRRELVAELFPDLVQRAAQRAGTLSGGQQQMVSLARALLNANRLLLVDEPTKGLAPRIVGEVSDALAEAARTVPILLVEQNLGHRAARRARRRDRRGPRRAHRPRARAPRRPRPCPAAPRRPRRGRPPRNRRGGGPVSTIVLLLVTGLGLGALYFLVASGLSLIYGLMGVLNFAHGSFLTLGAFGGWFVARSLGADSWGVFALSLLAGAVVGAGAAALTELLLIRPLYERHIEQVLVTVGLSLARPSRCSRACGVRPRVHLRPGVAQGHDRPRGRAGAQRPVRRDRRRGARARRDRAVPQAHPLRAHHPGGRREPVHGHRARHRRAQGVHARLRRRRRRRGLGGVLASQYFGYVSPHLGGSLLIFAFIVTVIGGSAP